MNYAKFVKEKQTKANTPENGLLTALLGLKNSENFTIVNNTHVVEKVDEAELSAARQMRMYSPTTVQRPSYLSYGPGYWKLNVLKNGKYPDGMYGFSRKSDFPQLAAYRAPFPPKSVINVMKYVTGPPRRPPPDFMVAQESGNRYFPIQAAGDVNNHLPEVLQPPKIGSRRFRNRYGPPVYLNPPKTIDSLPDDFMKPPDPNAGYAMNFENVDLPVDLTVHEESYNIPTHTDVVFHTPRSPVVVKPNQVKKLKKAKPKNKKPIRMMLDIYPITENENHQQQDLEQDEAEEEIEEEKEQITEADSVHNAFKHIKQNSAENLLLHLNLFPKFSQNGRRMSVNFEENPTSLPIVHLTTSETLVTLKSQGEHERGNKQE
ncbi:uncharacterized protein LOC126895554 isoform X2 [Daktulosphaira vitifoliae]|nr:uncharacterized protein LOC126895554 isoform X2 [Daktulosphaira vitifoliae]